MQVLNRVNGIAPVDEIAVKFTGPEFDTVLRALRRMQLSAAFSYHAAQITPSHADRAAYLHREFTGKIL